MSSFIRKIHLTLIVLGLNISAYAEETTSAITSPQTSTKSSEIVGTASETTINRARPYIMGHQSFAMPQKVIRRAETPTNQVTSPTTPPIEQEKIMQWSGKSWTKIGTKKVQPEVESVPTSAKASSKKLMNWDGKSWKSVAGSSLPQMGKPARTIISNIADAPPENKTVEDVPMPKPKKVMTWDGKSWKSVSSNH